jgi:lysozyme
MVDVRRMGVAAVVSTLAVLGIVGTGFWFVWLPGFRPGLERGEQFGIDVSAHQGSIDWQRVAHDRIGFAYIKATEGADRDDPRFQANWDGAKAAGIEPGAYHYFTLCRSGADQAANFLDAVPTDPRALAPAVDLEFRGNCTRRPEPSVVRRELLTFVRTVESTIGRRVVLYLGDDVDALYHVSTLLDRPIWTRNLLRRPGQDGWQLWQANDRGRVDGIDADVDIDVMGRH